MPGKVKKLLCCPKETRRCAQKGRACCDEPSTPTSLTVGSAVILVGAALRGRNAQSTRAGNKSRKQGLIPFAPSPFNPTWLALILVISASHRGNRPVVGMRAGGETETLKTRQSDADGYLAACRRHIGGLQIETPNSAPALYLQ